MCPVSPDVFAVHEIECWVVSSARLAFAQEFELLFPPFPLLLVADEFPATVYHKNASSAAERCEDQQNCYPRACTKQSTRRHPDAQPDGCKSSVAPTMAGISSMRERLIRKHIKYGGT
eukprot:Tamp_08174.p3 GENE.Tamp_08174~~Tamp_08174.p3  ORF type:complete len:118 (+),score=12.56 Tamp_08174:1304-1657(+)